MTRRAIRIITIAVMASVVVGCAAWVVAAYSGDTEMAVVHDTRLEPDVPMGALAVMYDATLQEPGDIIGIMPASRSEFEGFVFGPRSVCRLGSSCEPSRQSFGGSDPMAYYLPLVGYVVWFGPLGLAVFFVLATTVLYLTREPQADSSRELAAPGASLAAVSGQDSTSREPDEKEQAGIPEQWLIIGLVVVGVVLIVGTYFYVEANGGYQVFENVAENRSVD